MLQLMIDATGKEETGSEDNTGEKSGCPFHEKSGILSDKDVVGHARVVLLAGYETTANTLAYTSYLLALNPDIQEKLQSEIDSYYDEKPVSVTNHVTVYYSDLLPKLWLLNISSYAMHMMYYCYLVYRMHQLMKPAKRSHT